MDYSKLSDEELDKLLASQKDPSEMTDEELDAALGISAGPQEISKEEPKKKKDISKLESALAGAGQGISMGFGDELSGAAGYLAGKLGLVPDMGYEYYREGARAQDKAAQEANPKTYGGSQLAGGISTLVIPGLGAAKTIKGAAGLGAGMGAATGIGASEADLLSAQMAKDAALGAAIGGGSGAAGQKIGQAIVGSKAVTDAINKIADRFAVKATGATAAEAGRFAEGSGKLLRDKKLVKFFDSPSKIAERVSKAQETSGENIGAALKALDEQGVTASVENVVAGLEAEINRLNQTAGNEKIVSKLQKALENIYERGESNVPVSAAELAKRNFQKQVNFKSSNAKRDAAFKVSDLYKKEVEEAATKANPQLAEMFKQDKQLYSILAPIREASERRALQLNQSPFGGLLDRETAAATTSANPAQQILSMAGRRVIAQRLASGAATSTGAVADLLQGVNSVLGRAAKPTANAVQRGVQTEAIRQLLESLNTKKGKKKATDILKSIEASANKQAPSPWTGLSQGE